MENALLHSASLVTLKILRKLPLKSALKQTFIVVFLFHVVSYSQTVDIDLLKEINLGRNRSLDNVFRGVTNSIYVVTPAVPLMLFGYGFLNKNPSARRNALVISASLLTSASSCEILRYSIKRPRPFRTYPDIQNVTSSRGPSFPSGHTTAAFSLATSMSLAYPEWYVIAPSFLWAAAVGYSRMDLGVHYPSDVLFGAVLGTGSAILIYSINQILK
jgi:membrane-associated phospholipid phosphatase